ncbi:uncharacterized protein LOC113280511 [Papaver somniferum]|uniref:uncharacterized protein LOC113280511 n=1 Tax=Papaver somniferum TaxID=3469 RepID=UPI000E705A7F|nr:uncharacterized protein LOC113280511 [Papaver somniferum]
MPLRKISVEEASNLEKPILEEEVFSALKMLGQDKAPGPDGLQIFVVVKCWEFMKSDIMRVVKHFERNGFVDWRLKSNNPEVICKIDLEKAFYNVRWSCIDDVLIAMGFGTRWRTWIQGCLSRVPFSVLVNGSVCGKFVSEKGIRQGDPLSLFLFLLVSEILAFMFEKATVKGWGLEAFRFLLMGLK